MKARGGPEGFFPVLSFWKIIARIYTVDYALYVKA